MEVPEDVEVSEDAEVPAPADAGDGDHLCKTRRTDGYLQCPRCYQDIGTTTDARIATGSSPLGGDGPSLTGSIFHGVGAAPPHEGSKGWEEE